MKGRIVVVLKRIARPATAQEVYSSLGGRWPPDALRGVLDELTDNGVLVRDDRVEGFSFRTRCRSRLVTRRYYSLAPKEEEEASH